MKVALVVVFTILMLLAIFLLWVLAKISSRASEMEEQREIERKLRK